MIIKKRANTIGRRKECESYSIIKSDDKLISDCELGNTTDVVVVYSPLRTNKQVRCVFKAETKDISTSRKLRCL